MGGGEGEGRGRGFFNVNQYILYFSETAFTCSVTTLKSELSVVTPVGFHEAFHHALKSAWPRTKVSTCYLLE